MPVLEHRHDVGEDVVALTFDDGPSPWTGPILDLLAAHKGHGTFFTLGCAVTSNERRATLQRIVVEGSELGDHTFTHPRLSTLPDAAILDELARARCVIEETSETKLQHWRPPFYDVDERVRQATTPLGLREVGCSVLPSDWEWDAEQTAEFVMTRLRPGSIVGLHDGRPPDEPAALSRPTREATVAAVGMILDEMKDLGLRSVTISELLAAS
jgi:peptidoglycan/xylan/chitin deacetylase (PgdA/CDA1 family)